MCSARWAWLLLHELQLLHATEPVAMYLFEFAIATCSTALQCHNTCPLPCDLQMVAETLGGTFTAWREYVDQTKTQRGAAYKALYFWMNSRLRMAFNTLRWARQLAAVKKGMAKGDPSSRGHSFGFVIQFPWQSMLCGGHHARPVDLEKPLRTCMLFSHAGGTRCARPWSVRSCSSTM